MVISGILDWNYRQLYGMFSRMRTLRICAGVLQLACTTKIMSSQLSGEATTSEIPRLTGGQARRLGGRVSVCGIFVPIGSCWHRVPFSAR